MTDPNAGSMHLEPHQVAAYVDGRLDAQEAARLEAHLAQCDECRNELIEVRRLLPGTARRWRWPAVGALAAAAVLLLVLGRSVDRGDRSTVRGGEGQPAAPAVMSPADGATLPTGTAWFLWRGVRGAAAYRFTLTDERGDQVWSTESADTALALPASVHLQRGHGYYWSVDVLLADGRSATTGFRGFRVAP